MADDEPPWQLDEDHLPPPAVTRELFLQWRAARVGDSNPERMTNPVWTWLARNPAVSAYQANRHFAGGKIQSPGWTNHRFGQSQTLLPDGRSLAIAGEHEDWYDPDFYIYNDVIVTAPDGSVEIYGYPRDVFPPTDFHTATLVGDQIYVIGNLGYPETRGVTTQVVRVAVPILSVDQVATSGESPGWLSSHGAVLGADGRSIIVTGGQCDIELAAGRVLLDSADDYRLCLETLTWSRITDRRWTQYEVVRSNGRGYLWEINQLVWYVDRDDDWSREQAADCRASIPHEPDLGAWRARYSPPIAHTRVAPGPDEWSISRLLVDGTTVRYVEAGDRIHVVVEGPLRSTTIDALLEDLRGKLSLADGAPYVVRSLEPSV